MGDLKGRITIDESHCKSCGYCAHFCDYDCIVMPEITPASGGQPAPVSFSESDKGSDTSNGLTSAGLPMPIFAAPEKCGGCRVCAWLCPHFAIVVYEEEPETATPAEGPGARMGSPASRQADRE
jgi:NAD-dependent dihydropyrimidine dehydrogenase PreA subunit